MSEKIENKEKPLDQSALGFFIGFVLGIFSGMIVLLYASSIPLGQ